MICPSDNNKRFVTLFESDQNQLVANCPIEFPYLKVIVICCLDAGFRLGEILNLKWSQVDFVERKIKLYNWQTKTAKARTLPMSKRVYEILTAWKKLATNDNLFKVKEIKKTWNTLRNSINRPDLHIHDLRHCFATRLHAKGVGIATISRLLGHSSIKTTQIYINPSDDELKNAVSVLD